MSSHLLLRSAINTAVAAARCSRHASSSSSSFRTSALSTLSFDSSSFINDAAVESDAISSACNGASSKTLTSYLTNMIILPTLMGDSALIAVEKYATQLEEKEIEEEGETEKWEDIVTTIMESPTESSLEEQQSLSIWQISTLKRRKKMMNKHKLRKRRKKMRLKTRK
mmetsp:Transcript_29342/g.61869  ORF Transcript_29342/g.61869 Transcript_29342/m.61869 type:complete len:168 (+) Transcript_29342:217-720(+)